MIIASSPSFQPQVHSFLRDSDIVQDIKYTPKYVHAHGCLAMSEETSWVPGQVNRVKVMHTAKHLWCAESFPQQRKKLTTAK